ncbi:MAG: quinoprotein dehydrogenase-associated SoxYZ-like carrier [Pseudomonadota bacterium]
MLTAAIATGLLSVPASANGDEKYWNAIRAEYFGDRHIADGRRTLALVVPDQAEDAAMVPVTVRANFPQSDERWIKTVTLLIDKNPAPLAGRFHMTVASGKANIGTRIRVNEHSYVRAIAELNDGSLHMVKGFVRAAGGCSAPIPGNHEAARARMGRMKLKLPMSELPNAPNRARLMISHPNYSGMQADATTKQLIPAEFVQQIEVRRGGELVMRVETDISISENPNIQFYYSADDEAAFNVTVRDSSKREFEKRW